MSSRSSLVGILIVNIILLINNVSWIQAKAEENDEFQVNFPLLYETLRAKPIGLLLCQLGKESTPLSSDVLKSLSTSAIAFVTIDSDASHYQSLTKNSICSSTESTLAVFRDGKPLPYNTIRLDAVSDVDSLFSNIYHIWLMHDIEYVVSVDQLNAVHAFCEQTEKLVVFFVANAIGSAEHRRIGESIAAMVMDPRYDHLRVRLKVISTFETAVLSHLSLDSRSAELVVSDYSSSPPSTSRYPVSGKEHEVRRVFKSVLFPPPEVRQQLDLQPFLQDGDLLFFFVFVGRERRDAAAASLTGAMRREGLAVVPVIVDVSVPLDDFYVDNGFSPEWTDKTPYGAIYDTEKQGLEWFPLSADELGLNVIRHLLTMKMEDIDERRRKRSPPVACDETATRADINTILTEDDPLVRRIMKHTVTSPSTSSKRYDIRSLNETQFDLSLKNAESLVVLFGVKWDAGTKLLLETLRGDDECRASVAYVDCYDWNRVCARMDVFEYPRLVRLRADGAHREFRSVATTENVKAFLQTVDQPQRSDDDVVMDGGTHAQWLQLLHPGRRDHRRHRPLMDATQVVAMPEVTPTNLATLRNGAHQLLVLATSPESETDLARLKMALKAVRTERRRVAWMDLQRAINVRALLTLTGRVESPCFYLWDWQQAAMFATTARDDLPTWLHDVDAGLIAATAPLARRQHGPVLPAFDFVRMTEHQVSNMAGPNMAATNMAGPDRKDGVPFAGGMAPPILSQQGGRDEL